MKCSVNLDHQKHWWHQLSKQTYSRKDTVDSLFQTSITCMCDMDKCNKNQVVPSDSMGSRQRLGLSLVLLPMKHLSVQIIQLHFIIVQQAQAPWNIINITLNHTPTINSKSVSSMLTGAIYSRSSPFTFRTEPMVMWLSPQGIKSSFYSVYFD